MSEKDLISRDNLLAAFNLFDKDSSKSIDSKELMDVFRTSPDFDEEVALNIIKQVDKDGDGEINFLEFKAMMTQPFYGLVDENE